MDAIAKECVEAMKKAKTGREMIDSWAPLVGPGADMAGAHKTFGVYADNAPWMMEDFSQTPLIKLLERGVLDAKTRELIFVALCVDTETAGGIIFHIEAAAHAGATKEEIMEVLCISAYDFAKNHMSRIGEAVAEGIRLAYK